MTIASTPRLVLSGECAFDLYDTHGLPLFVIVDELKRRNAVFDVCGFIMAASRKAWKASKVRSTLLEAYADAHGRSERIAPKLDELMTAMEYPGCR